MNEQMLWLAAITLLAATVNGALGYGFSSITVPLALLFLSNRVLNPALIVIEVPLNAYVLWVNRASLPAVWRRVVPIMVGLIPGVVAGLAEAVYVPDPAAVDPLAGRRIQKADPVRALGRSGVWRRRRRAVLGHDHLGAAAGDRAQ
jgi:uncharacterized membrane protein YfcA